MEDLEVGGDETISLSDVLVARDTCLPEDELWALCRECCLVLEVVNNSPEMFDTLCVTPDTVAFDQVGNVCFLDLDVEPEPIYLPPEYSENGNTYKVHLFSLGMTLLYAAEYNVDHSKENISPELREVLGQMTADSPDNRPDLESTIILCEEQLCGQSSQEVCCGIAAGAGFGLPTDDAPYEQEDTMATTSYISDLSPDHEDFSQLESYVNSDPADTTCCDDLPDLTEDISQTESLPLSEHGEIIVTESHDDSLMIMESDISEMDNQHRGRVSPQDGNRKWGMSNGTLNQNNGTNSGIDVKNDKHKPAIPQKPGSLGQHNSVNNDSKTGISPRVSELIVSEIASESDESRIDSDKSVEQTMKKNSRNNSVASSNSVGKSESKTKKERKTSDSSIKKSNSSVKDVSVDNNQNVTSNNSDKTSSDLNNKNKNAMDNNNTRTKRNKRNQGLTISDILEALNRNLSEEELWALCKEGTAALQRKKKHLPAYLSPDTLVIREHGNVSFKAIPEEKPLEVIFMAPELQTKGELSEKTCLYGLSVTLRCAAGKKYSAVSAMNVSQDLQDLLQYLADSDPVKRPELSDIAKVCTEHSGGTKMDSICAKLFQDALKAMTEKDQQQSQQQNTDITISPVKEITASLANQSAFKPIASYSSFQPVKPANGFTSNIGGAFCPVPKKPSPPKEKPKEVLEPRVPSAFSSSATHFKPIILQQVTAPANENVPPIKEVTESSTKKSEGEKAKSSTSTPQKPPSPDNPNDKDKEVVKKLKELKKNLMKHRQPTMVKDLENEDKKSDTSSSKSSAPPKKSLPQIPKKSSKSSESSSKSDTSDMLDSLLKEMQKQGNAPDTQSLAAAIAQHLQGQIEPVQGQVQGQSKGEKPGIPPKPTGDLDMTVTSAQGPVQGQMLQDLNIPSQYHSQLLGQTMTLPMQYGGNSNVISGLPQFQFQHDPVTGFLQLVPVVNLRPQSVHSNVGSFHSDGVRNFVSPVNSGSLGKEGHMSPNVSLNPSDIGNISAISDNSGSKGKSQHGRTARDLVQKTANIRAKNLGRPSPSILMSPTDNVNMQKWKSDHDLNQSENMFYSENERTKHGSMSSLAFSNRLAAGFVYDDSMLNTNSRNAQMTGLGRPPPGHRSAGIPQYVRQNVSNHRTHSNSSSPSPSKDSGVSGMNLGVYRNLPPGTDASLMDRLLSNVNIKQQRILGRIVHLLREEFAFDGYMENGVEDINMAEYICSLGVLKWETFSSAICEKYSDLYWGTDLLANLYKAVNGNRPQSANRNERSRRNIDQRPSSKQQQDRHDDDSSGRSEGSRRTRNSRQQVSSQLSPPIGRVSSVTNNNNPLDTSDSTDTEKYGRTHKLKRKHELNEIKLKSHSSGNLIQNINNNSDVSEISVSNTKSEMLLQTDSGNTVRNNTSRRNSPADSNSVTLPRTSNHRNNSNHNNYNSNTINASNLPHSQKSIERQHSVDCVPTTSTPRSQHNVSSNMTNIPLNRSFDSQQRLHVSASMSSFPQSTQNNLPAQQLVLPNHFDQSQLRSNGNSQGQGQIQGHVQGHVVKGESPSSAAGLTRDPSMSSHSSSQTSVMREGESVTIEKRGHVVYHWAMIHLSMSTEIDKFMQDIDEENSQMLVTKLTALEQQIKMEKRVRRKTQKYYKNLTENNRNAIEMSKNDKTVKGERNQLGQVAKDISEMTHRISFLDLCKTHLQMLLAELQGIDVSYLYSIAVCAPTGPLQLHPRPDNPLLQFQTLREPHTGCEIQALHAGTPAGLMSYLFASTALSEGFIHQFLYCYRYFTTADDVFTFLTDRYTMAAKSGSMETNIQRLQRRVSDLLHFWLEGYFTTDFQSRPALVTALRNFIKDHIQEDSEAGQSLLALLSNCCTGNNLELSSADPDESEMNFWQMEEPKLKWESFKALVRGNRPGKQKAGKVKISAVCVERRRRSTELQAPPLTVSASRRTDMFMLGDYTSQCLAEQLCLIEQGIFQLTHPIHYLDSKCRGVSVAMTMKGSRTPAPSRRSGAGDSFGLFVEPLPDISSIQKMIDHSEEVSHWVAAEIVLCSNPKTQVAVLSKFVYIAHTCMELRNYATTMAILDGLENLIIKQLPAWKNLPAKCNACMDELMASRMFLKNDPLSLMQQGKDCHCYPTIPSALLFLLHIQQLEIGGFKLANQMYKWGKIRSIAQVIDQVRVFREHMYGFEADHNLQDTLRRRVHEMSTYDIHSLADQHHINYQKMPSGSGLYGALKKMKGKLAAK